jgi:pimeloyl-ACP methyl ester carboxylesterase
MLVRGLLEWVANHSGVDEAVIRGFLRDVSAYLELPGCRAAVQAVVRPALLVDPGCVLVGHSLGGVVCAELLAEDEVRDRTSLFVAVGAPLGLDAVTAGMRPPGAAGPTAPWVNVYDPRDWVALGSPLPREGGLEDQLAVANPPSHEHSIEHYLAHPEVATLVADALAAGT